jgi:hypothetical protein
MAVTSELKKQGIAFQKVELGEVITFAKKDNLYNDSIY